MVLNWQTKARSGRVHKDIDDYAVSITVVRCSTRNNKRMNLIFRMMNGAESLVTQTGYAVYALDKERNRVYFKNAVAKDGWKMTKDGGGTANNRLQIGVSMDVAEEWKARKGVYKLLLDRAETLYYIDLNRKVG